MAAALRMEHAFEAPVRVIPNARRDPGEAQTTTTKGKQELVFAAGRLWDEGKNIGALSAVAADLDWPVYVAGATQERDGNGPNLTHLNYLGRLDRQSMDRWLRQAAIYALPARYEPFGLSVLEAAMAGCALVLGDIASLRENWNGAALFVPPDDGEALQRTLQRLILDAELREQLAIEAHERAGRFSIADMAGAYLECYTQARAMVAA